MDELQKFLWPRNMKTFYATAEKILQLQCVYPVLRSVIVEDLVIHDREEVKQAIAKYLKGSWIELEITLFDTDEDLSMWTRLESATEVIRVNFTIKDA